jgi:rhodanese-related sulfurtransferase
MIQQWIYYGLGITGILFLAFLGYVVYERTMIHYLRITPEKARELIETAGAKVIDVRTDAEWSLGHYPSAIHIPASRLGEVANQILRKNEVIVIYCNTGTRARLAALELESLGYTRVFYIAETYQSLM